MTGPRALMARLRGKGAATAAPAPGVEDLTPPWSFHTASLHRWASIPRSTREGRDLPIAGPAAEHGDASARDYLGHHHVEELVAQDEWSAYVAYSVAELMVLLGDASLYRMEKAGAFEDMEPERHQLIRETLRATLLGGIQRIAWHSTHHLTGVRVEEPFGASVDPATLPPLVTREVGA